MLRFQPRGIGVRELSRIAGVYPRSAELALASLVDDGLVQREPSGRRVLYTLNQAHPDYSVVLSVIDAAAAASTVSRSSQLHSRGRMLLQSVQEVANLMSHARGHRT